MECLEAVERGRTCPLPRAPFKTRTPQERAHEAAQRLVLRRLWLDFGRMAIDSTQLLLCPVYILAARAAFTSPEHFYHGVILILLAAYTLLQCAPAVLKPCVACCLRRRMTAAAAPLTACAFLLQWTWPCVRTGAATDWLPPALHVPGIVIYSAAGLPPHAYTDGESSSVLEAAASAGDAAATAAHLLSGAAAEMRDALETACKGSCVETVALLLAFGAAIHPPFGELVREPAVLRLLVDCLAATERPVQVQTRHMRRVLQVVRDDDERGVETLMKFLAISDATIPSCAQIASAGIDSAQALSDYCERLPCSLPFSAGCYASVRSVRIAAALSLTMQSRFAQVLQPALLAHGPMATYHGRIKVVRDDTQWTQRRAASREHNNVLLRAASGAVFSFLTELWGAFAYAAGARARAEQRAHTMRAVDAQLLRMPQLCEELHVRRDVLHSPGVAALAFNTLWRRPLYEPAPLLSLRALISCINSVASASAGLWAWMRRVEPPQRQRLRRRGDDSDIDDEAERARRQELMLAPAVGANVQSLPVAKVFRAWAFTRRAGLLHRRARVLPASRRSGTALQADS